MKIAICGSMKFMDKMLDIKKKLEKKGHHVFLPVWENLKEANIPKNKILKRKKEYILEHFKKIKEADSILVLNYTKNNIKNYIGGNSLIEIGIAFDQGKKIFILNPMPKVDDLSYVTEIKCMEPIILDGNLKKIKK